VPDATRERLPDQLQVGLRLIFVGTAASKRSASEGHYYAHPGNRFWSALHKVGMTERVYEPREYGALLQLGIGFTDLSKSHAGMDHEMSAQSVGVVAFKSKIKKYRPKSIAFTSKKAASLFFSKPTGAILLGRQTHEPGFPEVFVLSSPSGAASSHWTPQPWHDLANWLKSQEQQSA
jgi:TDG/mug DNA glycosylase family protein